MPHPLCSPPPWLPVPSRGRAPPGRSAAEVRAGARVFKSSPPRCCLRPLGARYSALGARQRDGARQAVGSALPNASSEQVRSTGGVPLVLRARPGTRDCWSCAARSK
jgi:hypothetical protein